jgi:predicted nucleic acid-binding protein
VIVVDASALLEALLRTPAVAVERRLFEPGQSLHSPYLLDIEVAQVVHRYAANVAIEPKRGRTGLVDLADFQIRSYPHGFLLSATS